MKRIVMLFAVLFAACAPQEQDLGVAEGAAGSVGLSTEALCSDLQLQTSARNFLRAQYPAITSCGGAPTNANYSCTGGGGQVWTVSLNSNNPGVQVKRHVVHSQGLTRNWKTASSLASGACGTSSAWY